MSDEKGQQPRARPFWKRSGLWRHEEAIRLMISQGYSYEQIRAELGLSVTARQVSNFCSNSLGIRSRGGVKQVRRRAAAEAGRGPGEKSVCSEGEGERRGAQQSPPTPAPRIASISEALGPEPVDEWAQFRKS